MTRLMRQMPQPGCGPEELATVFGPALGHQAAGELIYAESAASATAGIWRFQVPGRSAILKVIRHGDQGSSMWQSGPEEGHWYYWKREALAYSSGLLDSLSADLRAASCIGMFDRRDGSVGLWLEDLGQLRPGREWDLGRYRIAAKALGRAQANSTGRAARARQRWLAREWLRRYVERRGSFLDFVDSPAWRHPLVRQHLPAHAAQEATAIWDQREVLLGLVEAAPLCLAHNDLHPGNLFADGASTVLIDWGFLGVGHLGEDPANLIFDAVLDFFVEAGESRPLKEAVIDGYLEGVRTALSGSDMGTLHRAIWAAGAVKYFWIPLAMVDAVDQRRETLNRRPITEALAAWAPVVPLIFEFAHRALEGSALPQE